jgi:dihydrofolate reductase
MKLTMKLIDSILKMRRFRAIAAVAENGTIGLNNKIPWHIPEELKFFRSMTENSAVLFGRKTFESIEKILPNRKNIVLSHSTMIIPGGVVVHSVEELLNLEEDIWVCGGSSIYQLLLPLCCELYISTIRGNYLGDATFPEYESMFERESVLLSTEQFYVTKFVNRNCHANA